MKILVALSMVFVPFAGTINAGENPVRKVASEKCPIPTGHASTDFFRCRLKDKKGHACRHYEHPNDMVCENPNEVCCEDD